MTAPALPPPPPTGGLIDRWLFQLWKTLTDTVTGRLFATLGLTVSGDTFISRGITDNATATALTIDASGNVGVGVTDMSVPGANAKVAISGTVNLDDGNPIAWGGTTSRTSITGSKSAGTLALSTPTAATGGSITLIAADASATIQMRVAGATGSSEKLRIASDGTVTLGGLDTAPVLKAVPVASQTAWITATGSNGGNPAIGTNSGDLAITSNIVNAPAYSNTTANAPNIYIDSNGKHYRSTFAVGGAVGGTVTSVGLAVPTGMSVSGTPVTGSGTITISLADDLAAVEAISTTGFVKRTALDTWSTAASIDLTADVTGDLPVTNLAGGTLDQGYSATPYNAGTKSSGTFTPDEANGNFQYCVNGGAFTLAPPTNNCTLVLQVTNNGSAGTITTSGFTKVSGYVPTTTNGDDFIAFITKINGFSHLAWQELQ